MKRILHSIGQKGAIILFFFLSFYLSVVYGGINGNKSEGSSMQDSLAGLYVNDFINILNNPEKEDSLLQYAQANGFNYLMLYNMYLVNQKYSLKSIASSIPLANFISKAKTQYGILQVGGSSETSSLFETSIDVYNQQHTDPDQRIDVYNLELEYWNASDTASAFLDYITRLKVINSLAHKSGVINEVYLGWPNQGQSTLISQYCDRILLHSYVTTDASVYTYARKRLIYFGAGPNIVTIVPIFNSKPAFMGTWLQTHSIKEPYETYVNAFNKDTGVWKQFVKLGGSQWYNYTNMPQPGCIAPPQPPAVFGNSSVLRASTNIYFVSQVNGATSYTWSLPSGWIGYSDSSSISVIAGLYQGTVSVTANGDCGISKETFLAVSSYCPLPEQPSVIAGYKSVTEFSTQNYSVLAVPGITSYTWTLPIGWTGSSISNSIKVKASNTSGTIVVRANNDCGQGLERTLSVCTVPLKPSSITGSTLVKSGRTYTYSTPVIADAISYAWSLPSGWVGVSSGNSIAVVAANSSGTISVRAKNVCGLSNTRSISVSVSSSAHRVGNNNDLEDNLLEVFPNPTYGELMFTFSRPEDIHISIFNSIGVEVMNKKIQDSEMVNLDMSSLTAGVYIMKVEAGEQTWYRKVVKQ